MFIHEDPEFPELLQIVAATCPISSAAMVEKDYWICHALWALENSGIEFWFKGGTSLSKAFQIIPRFSEDIDLIMLPGNADLPAVSSWRSESQKAIRLRETFWEAFAAHLNIPGAQLEWDKTHDPTQRNTGFRVHYPGHFLDDLRDTGSIIRPYVLLEISHGSVARSARAPYVTRPINSEVHEHLILRDQPANYLDNRPRRIACVHPYVTLLEKLDAITRRYDRDTTDFNPNLIARHYEDAARIIRHEHTLLPIDGSIQSLALEMLEKRQIRQLVSADHAAFQLSDSIRREMINQAYDRLEPMYWRPRIPFADAITEITTWLKQQSFAEIETP